MRGRRRGVDEEGGAIIIANPMITWISTATLIDVVMFLLELMDRTDRELICDKFLVFD